MKKRKMRFCIDSSKSLFISIYFAVKTTIVVQFNLLIEKLISRVWSKLDDGFGTFSACILQRECVIYKPRERRSVQNGRLLRELWINYGIWIRCYVTIDARCARDGNDANAITATFFAKSARGKYDS